MKIISICIPCFNEEKNILNTYNEIIKNISQIENYEFEIIFEDNCSTDSSVEILRDLASKDKRVKVILNKCNYGAMNNAGYIMFQATGEAVIGMPCDLQTPFSLIPELIKGWEEGNDVVLARKIGSDEKGIIYFLRKSYYKIINLISENKEIENVTGCGLFDSNALALINDLNDPSPNFRYSITELGLKYKLVDYYQKKRTKGKSSYSLLSYFKQAIQTFAYKSERVSYYLCFFGAVIAGLDVFKFLFRSLRKNDKLGNANFLLGIICFILGIQDLNVYDVKCRLKKRPLVIEKERINF